MGEVGAGTRVAGVVGWPIEHSLSPTIHNAAYRTLGLNWVYAAFPVRPGTLPRAVRGLADAGLVGVNVTMPHKEEAATLADELSEDAERLAAANVLSFGARVGADNTDAPGFARFLADDAGFDPAGTRAVIFGAGGAARACALALARGGLADLSIAARTAGASARMAAALQGSATTWREVPFGSSVSGADLIVNATPLGGTGERGTLALEGLHPGQVVVDLVYRPAITPLVAAARAAGADAFGGLGLLLHQAALTIELWTGQVAPLPEMSAAALAELAEDPRMPFPDPEEPEGTHPDLRPA